MRTPSAFVLLLVAIVSLIGVIIKSETDKAIARLPIESTLTAEARLTEFVLSSNMTQSAIAPSATLTPVSISTETLTPIPTATISDNTSNVLLQDDFIDNRNGWLLQHEQSIESIIIGGKYKLTVSCPSNYESFYCGNYFLVPNLYAKDLQFELDAIIKNLSPDAEVIIAFQIRRNDGNYYTVYFRSIGKYTVNIVYNGSVDKLLEETPISGIVPNTDIANR